MDPDCHPLTGSSEHYCLCDIFHQSNSKDKRDVLRTIGLVPELAGKINSQCAEQLFSEVRIKWELLASPSNTQQQARQFLDDNLSRRISRSTAEETHVLINSHVVDTLESMYKVSKTSTSW
ncbi:unnamed protein product [Leuciscus chuanchicus]